MFRAISRKQLSPTPVGLSPTRADSSGEVLAELRRFYRLTNMRKMAHIERS